ncbi:anti-repressor SinI family protein [Evansella cellulosilytica]|uniref:SinR repressor domain protein dimerization n=1 Tax=Evansella cellulosilytica (strain ATCC 21833 / DSM 2522 / FERM P-1141 / JCM 9156 / N-4) TaxID=649639 RepID=E6TXK0_EVAC2|nr:anti-repressor SinI family protein [Evansella cellulosilytica]ADU28814.1 SinR repressor domain protein dimerization [Evansella cellulosilytica DSM 2522]
MVSVKTNDRILDKEWIQLMKEAKQMGLSPSDIKQFLNKKKC